MKTLDQGQDKVKKLCDALKRETLEPAQAEARELVSKAHRQAEEIVHQARKEAAEVEQAARQRIEQERAVFHTSLEQACKQGAEVVRQSIEQNLLREELYREIVSATSDPAIIGRFVTAIIDGLEREGIEANLSAIVSSTVDPQAVNLQLGKRLLERLKEGGVVLGEFRGGAQVVLHGEKITLDMSSEALLELIGRFLRRDLREMLFRMVK